MANNNLPTSYGVSFLSFFTVLLIMTLNADNGKDLLDVIVPYIQALTQNLVDK